MIRNIIAAAILLATLVSFASVAQVASAVEPALNLDISAFRDNLAASSHSNVHPFSWTPDISQQERFIKLYERLVLPQSVDSSGFAGHVGETVASKQKLYSFEVYQGDGLDDLRQRSKHYNSITLPDEDTEAYGVSVKQRF
jgi:hypothetical protein